MLIMNETEELREYFHGKSWITVLGLSLALSVFIISQYQFRDTLEDDAYISMRYARNLVESRGLVFNSGERVEGYTNLLWVLLLSVLHGSGADLEISAMVLGAVSGVILILVVALFRIHPSIPRPVGLSAALLLAMNPAFQAESAMGLETSFFALAVFISIAGAAESLQSGRWHLHTGLALGLAAWIRPEGIWITGLTIILACILRREDFHSIITRIMVPASILIAGLFLFRILYYGRFLPNTFAAKTGMNWWQIERGWGYLLNFTGQYDVWVLIISFAVVFLANPVSRSTWFISVICAAYFLYVVVVGGDYKPSHRFLIPPLPFMYIFLTGACFGLSVWLSRKTLQRVRPVLVWTVFTAMLAGYEFWTLPRYFSVVDFMKASHEKTILDRKAGRWFADNAQRDETIATEVIGRIPYFSRLVTYDMSGLTDRHIARTESPFQGQLPAGHDKTDAAYILSRSPDYILFHSILFTNYPNPSMAGRPVNYYESEMWKQEMFHRNYHLKSVQLDGGGLFMNFFRRDKQPE